MRELIEAFAQISLRLVFAVCGRDAVAARSGEIRMDFGEHGVTELLRFLEITRVECVLYRPLTD